MFTKGQHREHGDHWAWRLTENYWGLYYIGGGVVQHNGAGNRLLGKRCVVANGDRVQEVNNCLIKRDVDGKMRPCFLRGMIAVLAVIDMLSSTTQPREPY